MSKTNYTGLTANKTVASKDLVIGKQNKTYKRKFYANFDIDIVFLEVPYIF